MRANSTEDLRLLAELDARDAVGDLRLVFVRENFEGWFENWMGDEVGAERVAGGRLGPLVAELAVDTKYQQGVMLGEIVAGIVGAVVVVADGHDKGIVRRLAENTFK